MLRKSLTFIGLLCSINMVSATTERTEKSLNDPKYLAQIEDEKNYYTEATSYAMVVDLRRDFKVDNSFDSDDSATLQRAIDKVSGGGGGKIIIPEGNYSFTNVELKSDVHLEIDHRAVIKPRAVSKKSYVVFYCNSDSATPYKNVSVRGVGGKFTIDLRDCIENNKVRCFMYGSLDNFLIENIRVVENETKYASFVFNGPVIDGVAYGAVNGVVKNLDNIGAGYGYGLVQMQFGHNILFKNLYGKGGVTLRLESHIHSYYETSCEGMINGIVGRNIICEDGHAALTLSPHYIKNGWVDVRDITANGCESALNLSGGFVNPEEKKLRLTPGYFSPLTVVRDIKATYSPIQAQIHPKHFKVMSESEQAKVKNKESKKSVMGPSIAVILDKAEYEIHCTKDDVVSHDGFQDYQIYLNYIK